MALDPSIAMGFKPPQFDSPLATLAQVTQVQHAQQQNRLADLMYQEKQRELSGESALSKLLSAGGSDADVIRGLAEQGYGKQAVGYQQKLLEQQKVKSEIGKHEADAGKARFETLKNALGVMGSAAGAIAQNPTYENALAITERMKSFLPPDMASKIDAATIPRDPMQLKQWATNQFLSTVDAAKQLEDQRVRSEGVLNRSSSEKIGAAHDATSRANNAATIAKDYAVAGLNPDGTASGDIDVTAKAIASGQLPPPSGMALTNPKNQRILSRVMEINPEYDFTTVTAKKKAASDFTSGTQGNALRSVATANAHLDQLGELADALNNGNIQIINKAKNAYQTATGNPAPTNFDAVKNVIGQEVVKAIVAGGGSAGERDEAAKAFQNAQSPAQLKGVIQHYRMIMGAQQQNLLEQRRAAGLSDSTLPNYGGKGSSAGPKVGDVQEGYRFKGGDPADPKSWEKQ